MAKRKNRMLGWLFLLLVAGVAVYSQVGSKHENTPEKYSVEKTGAGAVADFSQASYKMHKKVDEALTGAKLTAQVVQEAQREIPRQSVEGSIRWHVRQVMVPLAENQSVDQVRQLLEPVIKEGGGVVFGSQPDNYQGTPVTRLDIGIKDNLAGDAVTIITDKVYLAKAKKTAAHQPETAVRGEMAIIIDDFGYSQEPIGAFAALGRPVTFSVLPYKTYSNEAASRALSAGQQVMLHLPMEPLSASIQQEDTTIRVGMGDSEIQDIVSRAIRAIPGASGVNNHEGSKATADRRVMEDVLKVIKTDNLFFIDSRTNSQSVAFETARQMGIRSGENELFIDNNPEVGAVKAQLRAAAQTALRYGSVIVIGHARMNTAAAIRESIPDLEASGIKLVYVSQFVR